jgi:hypothetical protein
MTIGDGAKIKDEVKVEIKTRDKSKPPGANDDNPKRERGESEK